MSPKITKRFPTEYEMKLRSIHEKLEKWTSFVRELPVLPELVPAVASGRFELIKAAAMPRPLSAEECGQVFDLIAGLLETNAVLREHAEAVADGARYLRDNINGALSSAEKLHALACFEALPGHPDEDEE